MIPRTIFTIWLNETSEIPSDWLSYVNTHNIPGYEHKLITIDNCFKDNKYVQDCLDAKKWVKAADYLRVYYLYNYGGIYLDADTQVLEGKNFDEFLDNKFFACKETNGFIANGIMGGEQGLGMFKEYLETVESNFIGSGSMVFEPGMRLLTDLIYRYGYKTYEPEYFLPYNHQTKETKITDKTITYHPYKKSWL